MDFDEDVLLLALLIVRRKKSKKQKTRRWWVRDILTSRVEKGLHHTLHKDLEEDEENFFAFFRMRRITFHELLERVGPNLKKADTTFRTSITPEERLAVTLRYLGTGCSMADLHLTYRIGYSTISNIIREVRKVLWTFMKDSCFPQLTEEILLQVAHGFKNRANFPNCVGAIDGKHVRIIKPENSGSLHYNYKHFFSIVLLAVCDSNYKFMFIDVGAYGKSSDSSVFKNSILFKKLCNNEIKIPESRPLPGQRDSSPYVMVGDEAFGLSRFILRPYAGQFLPPKKRVFNYRLSRARRYIECSFGILSNKWRILHRPLNVGEDLSTDIVKACCLLHNFVREKDGYRFADSLTRQGFDEMAENATQVGRNINSIRDRFADYFMSEEGQVPWQFQKI